MSSSLKLAKVPPFTGKQEEYESFKVDLQLHFLATAGMDAQKVAFARSNLTDEAAIWCNYIMKTTNYTLTISWQTFKQHMDKHFLDQNAQLKA
jgi:hypothetical protein